MGKFRAYLNHLGLNEDDAGTASGDVAQFTGKMDLVRRNKHLEKGKKCQTHGKLNCVKCSDSYEDKKWK